MRSLAPLPWTTCTDKSFRFTSFTSMLASSDTRTPVDRSISIRARSFRFSQAPRRASISTSEKGCLTSSGNLMLWSLAIGFFVMMSSFTSHWKNADILALSVSLVRLDTPRSCSSARKNLMSYAPISVKGFWMHSDSFLMVLVY